MSFRKLILSLCWLTSLNHAGVAQVNSRDPHLSPDFQTTCDEQVNNERVARAVPASDPTPIPAPSPAAAPAPTTANPENAKLPVDQIIQNAIRRDEELRELREEFTYQLKLVTQRLDDDNKVIPDKTKTVTAKIKPGKDITFSADFNDDSKGALTPPAKHMRVPLEAEACNPSKRNQTTMTATPTKMWRTPKR